jgi:agmatinase
VVEVSPPYDNQGAITALLGNRVIHQALTGTAMRRLGLTEPGYLHPEALDHGVPSHRQPAAAEKR